MPTPATAPAVTAPEPEPIDWNGLRDLGTRLRAYRDLGRVVDILDAAAAAEASITTARSRRDALTAEADTIESRIEQLHTDHESTVTKLTEALRLARSEHGAAMNVMTEERDAVTADVRALVRQRREAEDALAALRSTLNPEPATPARARR